jgi:cysteine desulfurase/selenocysteine lyase
MGPVISFSINNIHAYDIAKLLDTFGICLRAGHHCAQPILNKYNLTSINRISLYFYNTKEEIDKFYESLLKVIKILS